MSIINGKFQTCFKQISDHWLNMFPLVVIPSDKMWTESFPDYTGVTWGRGTLTHGMIMFTDTTHSDWRRYRSRADGVIPPSLRPQPALRPAEEPQGQLPTRVEVSVKVKVTAVYQRCWQAAFPCDINPNKINCCVSWISECQFFACL